MSDLAKVLIVDDIRANRIALRKLLKNLDVDIYEAESGNSALMLSLKISDIAIILLDVQMPEMDGFEVAELLKEEEKTKHVPVIFITAVNRDESHVINGYKTGAVDYIQKPIIPEILVSKVSIFVDLWKTKNKLEEEIACREEANRAIQHLARHDLLTQLPNRVQLMENINQGIARVNRYKGYMAILFLDLDGLLDVNYLGRSAAIMMAG